MKTGTIQRFIYGISTGALIGMLTFISTPANAAHEMIYAVDTDNNLINFWSDAPATILNAYAISGIQNAEEIRGLDYWNGTLYGLGSFSRLYTITEFGTATQVGGVFVPPLSGQTFGTDNGPAGLQVVSGLSGGQNLLVNRGTAAVTVQPNLAYAAGDPLVGISPRVDALAYDDATGVWYAGDTLQNSLATLNPATGLLNTIGLLGIDASRYNGMDVSPFSSIMYMGTPAASSDPQANLYTVNKVTGMSTLIGQIGAPGDNYLIRGLTVVPEPGGFAFLALGFGVLFLARRRQE